MDLPQGLSELEAAERLAHSGPNVVHAGLSQSLFSQIFARFKNPLIILLIASSLLSAFTGELASATIIIVMVALSLVLDFVQEHRAGRAFADLRKRASLRAKVIRGGISREIPAEDVVEDDVVSVIAGDIIPADGKLIDAKDLFVNQALLTGESYPIEKHTDSKTDSSGANSTNGTVFMGTSVVSGSGTAVVTATGQRTSMGEISHLLGTRPPPTSFEGGTKNFGLLILRLAFLMVLFVLFVNLARGRPWLETFLFAIALAVGLTPELLPMVVSVTLAKGALRMSKKKVLVKRLEAIHDLGSIDILCTDKTGTLTEAKIELRKCLDPNGLVSERVFQLGFLNSHFETGLRSPLDDAIMKHGGVDIAGWEKIDEVPFDFERRRVSVLLSKEGVRLLVIKGALEDILALSTHIESNSPKNGQPMTREHRHAQTARFEALGREGYRVLGIAYKVEPPECQHIVINDECELSFAGFLVFEDPPKLDAGVAMKELAQLGVKVTIVSGDNELVAAHVCSQIGIPIQGVLTGQELRNLDEQALFARVETTNLFCRLDPAQKNRVIMALKKRGHVVGYLGDGINDAPALHSADVGISVDNATDAAKNAADIILLERNLSVLKEGVLEGRRTLGNIVKYILMGTSSNFGNMFSMAGASLFLPFLPMRPIQILANNFLYDFSELSIPTDRVDDSFLERPHRWDIAFIRRFMVVIGPVSSVFDFGTFFLLMSLFGGDERLFQTGWFVESLATQVLVIFVIRTQGNPFRSRPSKLLFLTSFAAVGAAMVLPFTRLGELLGLVPLPLTFFAFILPMVAAYLCAVEAVKRWFYRRFSQT